MGYAALTHPTQEFGVIKSMILRGTKDLRLLEEVADLGNTVDVIVRTTAFLLEFGQWWTG
jgi:hypothetical protein